MKINTRVVAAEITTGKRLVDVPFTAGSFDDTLNDVGNIQVSVPLYDFDVRALDLDLTGAPAHTLLGIVCNDQMMQGGPVWKHSYDKDTRTLDLTAANSWSYWNHRAILPVAADTMATLVLANGQPDERANTTVTNVDLGTLAKRIVQVTARAGESIPVLFEDDRAGTVSEQFLGADLNVAGSVLTDITGRIGGPDIRFDLGWNEDKSGLVVRMRTGSAAQPRLFGQGVVRWDYSVQERSIRNLKMDVDAQEMANVSWATGGRVREVLLMDRRTDGGVMKSHGYPRLDMIDTSHSSVEDSAILKAYNQETLRLSNAPTSFWEFEVRKDRAPFFGTYRVGDYCTINIKNDPYIADGEYVRRIVSMSTDLTSVWAKITTGVVVGLDPVDVDG